MLDRLNGVGQSVREPQTETADTGPAAPPSGTKSKKRGRQRLHDTQVWGATARPDSSEPGTNSAGHRTTDIQDESASSGGTMDRTKPTGPVSRRPLSDRQSYSDTHGEIAVAGDDPATAAVIAQIRPLWRQRRAWHRAEKSLTLQCKAICRGFCDGDKKLANKLFDRVEAGSPASGEAMAAISILPLLGARAVLEPERARVEKELERLAKHLPIWKWVEGIRGVGPGSLAAIVGECGDVGSYKSVSAVWKRMGLAVFGGERQRRKSDAEAAAIHGYSPSRRSVMWNIGGGLVGGMGKGPRPRVGEDIEARDDWSPYQKLFVRLLRLEAGRVTETWNGPEHRRDPVERDGELFESYSKHAAARIKRRVEKQFLADLYGEWRRAALSTEPEWLSPAASNSVRKTERSARTAPEPTRCQPSALIPDAAQAAGGGHRPRETTQTSAAAPSSSVVRKGKRRTTTSAKPARRTSGAPNSVAAPAVRRPATAFPTPRVGAPDATNSDASQGAREAIRKLKPNHSTPPVNFTKAAPAARRSAMLELKPMHRPRSAPSSQTAASPASDEATSIKRLPGSAGRSSKVTPEPTITARGATNSDAGKPARRRAKEVTKPRIQSPGATSSVAATAARRAAIVLSKTMDAVPPANLIPAE
jgi:hypothetical protein